MRVLIFGGGSVGLGVASCLLKAGAEVDIIGRENTIAALREGGLIRFGIFGEFYAEAKQFRSYTSLDEIQEGVYDYILVCVKSFDTLEAAEKLSRHKRLFGENTKIVLFQNGWGNAKKFLSYFEKERVYSARVITGFHRVKENKVEVTVHAASIHIGSLFGRDLSCVEGLSGFISKGDIPCETTDSVDKDLWAKMMFNCTLNPLGAILDVPYGVLGGNEYSRAIMNGIVEEIFDVIAAAGYKTHWGRAEDFLEVFYKKLVPNTAEHKSSTLQDILAGKNTEIDALNGAVIKLAQEYKVEVPYNLAVYNMIKFIEKSGQNSK
ncbi:MAG: 2-dehydropantoate 2-reductase [Planctomycetota bacterium]|nr:MAG: 2-dehydropantoate 2-reductase [Planctomycetota bacterium]